MDAAAFDYELPAARIAQRPATPRDSARLLVDRYPAPPDHRAVRDLPELLQAGDVMVVNDTRVLPGRLHLRKPTGGAVEVLLLERRDDGTWEALVRPGRRVPAGTVLTAADPAPQGALAVEVHGDVGDGRRSVRLLPPPGADELAVLERVGVVPLPPYITAPLDDPERYQTVYARRAASAAAPTAGLHLTPEVLASLAARGIPVVPVELVVGVATFAPITAARIEDHTMHGESYCVPDATWAAIDEARRRGGRVVAVGTTTVRALEAAAVSDRRSGRTDLYIRPGFEFEVVDVLLTNFHLPRSSLLVLLEAFMGGRWRGLYDVALEQGYRFLSFGDAMLVARAPTPVPS